MPAFAGLCCCVLFLSGCASLSDDHGFGRVAEIGRSRLQRDVVDPSTIGDAELRTRIDALTAAPLSADAAVEIALLANRELRATYRELGIAEADLVQAGRLPNPGIAFKHVRGSNETSIERTFAADLVAIVTMPFATRIERSRFDAVQLTVADALLKTAAATRRAWVDAVAAQARVAYAAAIVDASDAGADLAVRMRAAGNWNALSEARERSFAVDAASEYARAKQAAVQRRERLTRLLGLSGKATAYRLPSRLPDLPTEPVTIAGAEQYAMEHRLDLEADRVANRRLAQSLGLSKATRFVQVLEVGRSVDDRGDGGGTHERGYEIRIEVPLFDDGSARVARSKAVVDQALERSAQHAIDAASDVRERHAGYRSAWEIAHRQQTEVVPTRQRISAANLARYNGMLISVFELIADAREQTGAVMATLDAIRDFWIADVELAEAMGGTLPPGTTASIGEPR